MSTSFPNSGNYSQRDRDFIIINGRRIPCDGGMRGSDIVRAAGVSSGRRVVSVGMGKAEAIDPDRVYTSNDLKDRHGNPVKIKTMPDRTKGAPLFFGPRHQQSRQLITEQVFDVAQKYATSGLDFDEEDAHWMIFPQFRLPRNWSRRSAALMVIFPTDYPVIPPIGFYLPSDVPSPHGHKFSQAYHDASAVPLQEGWDWYCCTVNPGAWRPTPANSPGGWRSGDNLWTYITLINEVLGNDGK